MDSSLSRPISILTRAAPLVAAALVGLAVVVGTTQLAGATPKQLIGVILAVGILLAGFLSGYPREIFLFLWVFSLTYNRQYFLFTSIAGEQGSQGPYVIASDFFLILLILVWLHERLIQKVQREPRGAALWPWYLPFVCACVLSSFASERLDWTAYEMIRVAKVGFLLYYIRRNFGKREWWLSAAGMGCALTFQSILGTIEVLAQQSGVLWLIGLGSAAPNIGQRFEGEFSQEVWYGQYRATATMSHPPNLACYMLQTIPLFAALAFTLPKKSWRVACGAVTLIGLMGLGATMSRWPWALAVMQLVTLLIGLVGMRVVPAKRVIGVALVVMMAAIMAIVPLTGKILARVTGDLDRSAEGRLEELRLSWEMFNDRPFLGVGLNNSHAHILEYRPELAEYLSYDAAVTKLLRLRVIVSPQNGFVFILIEAGVIGLLAWLIYLTGVMKIGVRAIASASGYQRAACFGLVLGLCGVIAQQAVDFSYWVDPLLYTFTLVVGLLATASVIEDPVSAEAVAKN